MKLSQSDSSEKEKAKPFSWFIALYFFWVGGVSWVPYNAVTNSYDYFETKFPNDNVSFLFPNATYVANFVLILVITYLSNYFSYNLRMAVPMTILIFLEIIIPIEAYYLPNTTFGIYLIMILLFVMSFLGNMCYASICGFTSQVGNEFTTYYMIGVAAFGLTMNLLKEAVLLIYQPVDDGEIANILVYFGIAALIVIIGLVLHIRFMRSTYYKIYFEPVVAYPTKRASNEDINTSLIESNSSHLTPKKNLKTVLDIFMGAKFRIGLMFILLIEHATFFPGVMLLKPIPSMANHTKTVTMITTFNFFYIIGKKLAQYRQYYNVKMIVTIILLRLLIIAGFIVQVLAPEAPVIQSLWFAYLNIALAGITMGFSLVSLLIMICEVFPPHKKEVAGFVGVIGMNIGSMIGGFLALAFQNL